MRCEKKKADRPQTGRDQQQEKCEEKGERPTNHPGGRHRYAAETQAALDQRDVGPSRLRLGPTPSYNRGAGRPPRAFGPTHADPQARPQSPQTQAAPLARPVPTPRTITREPKQRPESRMPPAYERVVRCKTRLMDGIGRTRTLSTSLYAFANTSRPCAPTANPPKANRRALTTA